jgi:hypothetical protein
MEIERSLEADCPPSTLFPHIRDLAEYPEWVLRAQLDALEGGTRLTMLLRYGGTLWTGGVLERVLDDQVRRGSEALLELVSAGPTR